MYFSDFFIFGKLIEWRCFVTYLWNDPRILHCLVTISWKMWQYAFQAAKEVPVCHTGPHCPTTSPDSEGGNSTWVGWRLDPTSQYRTCVVRCCLVEPRSLRLGYLKSRWQTAADGAFACCHSVQRHPRTTRSPDAGHDNLQTDTDNLMITLSHRDAPEPLDHLMLVMISFTQTYLISWLRCRSTQYAHTHDNLHTCMSH